MPPLPTVLRVLVSAREIRRTRKSPTGDRVVQVTVTQVGTIGDVVVYL